MQRIQRTCGTCCGLGKRIVFIPKDTLDFSGTAIREERICNACEGKGYNEYARFTVEEAAVILKHCGIEVDA